MGAVISPFAGSSAPAGPAGGALQGTYPNPVLAAAAPLSAQPADPAGTISTTLVMMGLAVQYTPARSGLVQVSAQCYCNTTTNVTNMTVGPRFGTGAPPANGVAVTGTRFGSDVDPTGHCGVVGIDVCYAFNAILALAAGTTYWFDFALATAIAADQANMTGVSMSLVELPVT